MYTKVGIISHNFDQMHNKLSMIYMNSDQVYHKLDIISEKFDHIHQARYNQSNQQSCLEHLLGKQKIRKNRFMTGFLPHA